MIYKISISIYLHVVMITAVVVNKSAEEKKFFLLFLFPHYIEAVFPCSGIPKFALNLLIS